jgi:hypothetical protein
VARTFVSYGHILLFVTEQYCSNQWVHGTLLNMKKRRYGVNVSETTTLNEGYLTINI